MRLSELPRDELRVIMSTLRDMRTPLLELTLTCKTLYEAGMEVLVRSVLIDTPSAEVIRGFAGLMTRRPDLASLVKNLIIHEAHLEEGQSDAHGSQDFYYAVGLLAVAVTRMESLQGVTLGQFDTPGYPSADVRVHDAISGSSSISSIRLSGRGEKSDVWYDFIRKVKSPISDLSITGISGTLSSNLNIPRILGKFSASLRTVRLTSPQIRDDLGNATAVLPFARTLVIIFGLVRTDILLRAFPDLENLTVRTGALSVSVRHLNLNCSRKFWKKLSLLDVDLAGYEGLFSPPCRVTHLRIYDWIYSDYVLSALSMIHNLKPILLSITVLQGTTISLLQHISDAVDKILVLNLVILPSDHPASLAQFLVHARFYYESLCDYLQRQSLIGRPCKRSLAARLCAVP